MCLMKNTRKMQAALGCNTSPEWVDSLGGQHSLGAVNDAIVGLVQTALLDHLILNTNIRELKPGQATRQPTDLILDQELHSLDGGGRGLGDSRSNAGEQKVLSESQFLVRHVE